jgi:DNA-binding transcriptional MerR regulator
MEGLSMLLKIGELAKRIGVTVRTLHHYDAIGLVKPSARSDAGYRLYNRNDIARLHRIQALRGLGMSLAETDALLAGDGADLHAVISQQITGLERQISEMADLRDRLQALEAQLDGEDEPDIDSWLSTLRLMTTHRKYFTQDELEALFDRKTPATGEAWRDMIAAVRGLMDRAVPAHSKEAQELASRWLELQSRTMTDDPRLFVKLSKMHRTEFDVQTLTGIDGPLLDYLTMAIHELKCGVYAQYFSEEELAHFRENFPKCATRWQQLFVELRHMMEQGVTPEHPDAKPLLMRWLNLFRECWGDDPAMRAKVRDVQRANQSLLSGSGLNEEMLDFVRRGMMIYAPIPDDVQVKDSEAQSEA